MVISAEHGDEHAGGAGVVEEAVGRWRAPDVSVRFVGRSDSGVSAGCVGPECNVVNRERSKVSRGNKRGGAPNETFGLWPAHGGLVACKTRQAMWFMGERGGMTQKGSVACLNSDLRHGRPPPYCRIGVAGDGRMSMEQRG